MNAWKVILAALVIYVAGIVTGNFAANLSPSAERESPSRQPRGPRPPMMRDLVRRMESRLELTEEQKTKVENIVEASQERMRTLMDGMRPKFETESESMRLEIEALLSNDQKATFDKIFEHRGKRPRGGNGRGSGRRGPGGNPGEERFERGFRGDHESREGSREGRPPGRPRRPALEPTDEGLEPAKLTPPTEQPQ